MQWDTAILSLCIGFCVLGSCWISALGRFLHWVAAGFLHWIAAACSVWAAVLLSAIASISLIDAIAKLAYVSGGESGNKYTWS